MVRLTLIFNMGFGTSGLCYALLKFLTCSGTSSAGCSQWWDAGQLAFSGTAQILMCVVFRHLGLCKSSSLGPDKNFACSHLCRDYWGFFCVEFVTASCCFLGMSPKPGSWVWCLWILLVSSLVLLSFNLLMDLGFFVLKIIRLKMALMQVFGLVIYRCVGSRCSILAGVYKILHFKGKLFPWLREGMSHWWNFYFFYASYLPQDELQHKRNLGNLYWSPHLTAHN